jgi:HlyD family secretion protein
MRKLIAIALIVVLAAAGFMFSKVVMGRRQAKLNATKEQTAVPVRVTPAATGALEEAFALDGAVQGINEVGIYTKVPGKIARLHYDDGQWVPQGALVVEVDSSDMAAQVQVARASLRATEARAAQARHGYSLQTASTGTGVEQAQAGLAAAQARLAQAEQTTTLTGEDVSTSVAAAREQVRVAQASVDALKAGARPQERAIAREAVNQAKANLDTASVNLDRARRLLQAQAWSQQQFDGAKLQYDVALAQYQQAVQQSDLTEEGPRKEDIRGAEAQLAAANAGLAKAKAMQLQVGIRRRDIEATRQSVREADAALRLARASGIRDTMSADDIKAADAAVAQARANLQYAQASLSYAQIYAPAAGWVVHRNVRAGEYAAPGVAILDLVDNRNVKVLCALSEERRRLVSPGQTVQMTVDALPGQCFLGTVKTLSAAARGDARAFEMDVRLPNPGQTLKSGMFARVTVATRRQTGLVVPLNAVVREAGKSVVYVADGTVARMRPVEPGLRQRDRIVILRGLRPGEQVIVEGQTEVKDGVKVSVEKLRGDAS